MELVIIVSLLLIGPVALVFGADSRRGPLDDNALDRQRWWPGDVASSPGRARLGRAVRRAA